MLWGTTKRTGFKYANSERSTRDNIGLLLDGDGHLTNKTQTKQGCLMPSSPLSSIRIVGPETPRALSWRTVTMNSQTLLNLCRICCSTWMRINLWHPMGFRPGFSKTGWCHHKTSLNYFSAVLRIWGVPSQLAAGKCPSFEEGQERFW